MTNVEKVVRTHINGVEVIATEPARGVVIPGQPEHEVSTVERVLLENGEQLFRCKSKPDECAYANVAMKSVLAHQRAHSPILTTKKVTAELAKVRTKQNAEFTRRSNGMTTANEAKRKRHEAEATSKRKDVAAVQRKISDLAHGIEKIAATLPPLAVMLRDINAELAELPDVDIDPTVVEKAKKYDALKGLIND